MLRKVWVGVLLFLVLATAAYWRYTRDQLVLKRIAASGVDAIDTLESYPQKGLFLVGLRRDGALGRFSYRLGIERSRTSNGERLLYEVQSGKQFRVSRDALSFVDVTPGEANWGWFAVKDGKVLQRLPGATAIADSLRQANPDVFVTETNGYFGLFRNGKKIRSLNYGNIRTRFKDRNFDSLDHRLYRLSGDSMIIRSNEADDLFRQTEGMFFIPGPGYGVTHTYPKKAILDSLDSLGRLPAPPASVRFSPGE